jgi:hypothetical protein
MIIDINDMNFEIPDDLMVTGGQFDDLQKVIYNCLKAIINTDNIRICGN